ncbi:MULTISPECIES: GDSL-type esterase/lipase family protein [unclassified Salinibacterium]|uniref:GDSL-type esterase/lipase family protein n=1 Tax=unclassified Salinibacterium TaxID=2632331 RepID=UPI001423856C|nr:MULTISPECIES: GDSL-type esterase/lipase family protein [unclassified Salinibacterium]
MPEKDSPDRIVFVGDRLTADGRWQDWFPEHEALNFGVAGQTTEDLLGRRDEIVAARPDAIVMLIGSNDFSARRRSAEYVVRNVESILWDLRRDLPGVRLLLQSIIPRGHELADEIRNANRHLWQFAATVRAQYLDLWPALALPDGELNPAYSDDREHLNEAGYEAWLNELRPGLERLYDAPPMSRPISVADVQAALRDASGQAGDSRA